MTSPTRPTVTQRVSRLFALCLCLVAFALRLQTASGALHDYDHSYQHGVALTILDAIGTPGFDAVMLHAQTQSLRLPNPILSNYLFALVALFDRSSFAAVFASIGASTLAALFTYALGRRLWGDLVGLTAGIIAASSPWNVYLAQGAWQIGFFELSIVLPAYLWIAGAASRKPRLFYYGTVAAAFCMHVYVVSFGLVLQLAGVTLVNLRRLPARVIAMSFAALALSASVFVIVIEANTPGFLAQPRLQLAFGPAEAPASVPNPFGLYINSSAIVKTGNLVSGADYAQNPPGAANPLAEVRALPILFMLVMGLGLALNQARYKVASAAVMMWFIMPLLFITALTSMFPGTPVSYNYLSLVSPAAFLIAGLPAGLLRGRIPAGACAAVISVFGLGWAVSCGVLINQQAALVAVLPPAYPMDTTLSSQLSLAPVIRERCAFLAAQDNPYEDRLKLQYWAASLAGGGGRVRPRGEMIIGSGESWISRADGGSCMLRLSSDASVLQADRYTGKDQRIALYVTRPHVPNLPDDKQLLNNIGWRLVTLDAPDIARPGQAITVTQVWRIEQLPQDSIASWRYDTFVKLLDEKSQVRAQSDVASIPGSAWRVGEILVSRVRLTLPADLGSGAYQLELTSYDRARGQNAAYVVRNIQPLAAPEPALVVNLTIVTAK